MKIQIITLFPEMFEGVFKHSMLYKAQEKSIVDILLINLRDFGQGPRKRVDDTPYGGGDGMLLRVEPIFSAVEKARENDSGAKIILLSPRGRLFKQSAARELSETGGLIIICGRYEGIDERVTTLADYELSVGKFVLTGGEIPAMAVVDSVVRLLPGVLGGEKSAENESFYDGKSVEYAQYTRPEEFRGLRVPKVLLSGDHQEIEQWRQKEAAKKTNNTKS